MTAFARSNDLRGAEFIGADREHLRYAVRDLDAIEAKLRSPGPGVHG